MEALRDSRTAGVSGTGGLFASSSAGQSGSASAAPGDQAQASANAVVEPKERPKADITLSIISKEESLSDELTKLAELAGTTISEMVKARADVPEADKANYAKFLDLVVTREKGLQKWLGEEKSAASPDNNIASFEKYQEESCKPGNERHLPCPDFKEVRCFGALQKSTSHLMASASDLEASLHPIYLLS
jgi:hypothetical protein